MPLLVSVTTVDYSVGAYVGFSNPATGRRDTFAQKDDKWAARRAEIKTVAQEARRAGRHHVLGTGRNASRLLKRRAAGASKSS